MLYGIILTIHNALRWLVLGSSLLTVVLSYVGWLGNKPYRPADQTLRVVATSIAHTQLLAGMYLYTLSPFVRYYWTQRTGDESFEFSFFSLVHSSLMLTAIVIMTIGSSKAKRQADDRLRFKTTALYFTVGLLLILIAVPWPFSPLANRPLVRTF